MHMKREKIPKNWPIRKKGSTYIVRPNSNIYKGIPVLIILRDILKIGQNRREIKKALHEKKILLNNKQIYDEKDVALLFDIISLKPSKKHYRLELNEKGKFLVEEISEKIAEKKIAKIIGKKTLKGKKTQINLSDGRNFISNTKCQVNDSVVVNLKDKAIEKCLPLREKENILIFDGKHAGEKGIVNKIFREKRMVEAKMGEKQVNVLIKQMMVVE